MMRRHALFIGIDDYSFAELTSCVNDAVQMRNLLISLGLFATDECTLMTSPSIDIATQVPTRKKILKCLLDFYEATVPLDRLLIFYAGHGLVARLGRAAEELRTVIVPA